LIIKEIKFKTGEIKNNLQKLVINFYIVQRWLIKKNRGYNMKKFDLFYYHIGILTILIITFSGCMVLDYPPVPQVTKVQPFAGNSASITVVRKKQFKGA